MNFGKLDDEALDGADLSLPPESPHNRELLQSHHRQDIFPRAWVGCAEYRVREWNSLLYPPGTKEADMLRRYSQQYNAMEMNGTHYRIYEPGQIRRWSEKVAVPDFRFVPKFPQAISHESASYDEIQRSTAAFLESMDAFRPCLGPLFLQLSEWHGPEQRAELFRYLASLPEGFTYFLELRHPAWFTDETVRGELFTALRELGVGAVITDTPGHREVCHMELTLPLTVIRFVGRHPSTSQRIQAWMQRLKTWLDAGLQEVYFFVHTGLSAPKTSVEVIRAMNEVCGFALKEPRLWEEQTLF